VSGAVISLKSNYSFYCGVTSGHCSQQAVYELSPQCSVSIAHFNQSAYICYCCTTLSWTTWSLDGSDAATIASGRHFSLRKCVVLWRRSRAGDVWRRCFLDDCSRSCPHLV